HLVNFLRARGKRVVIIAVSHTLSQILADNLDELLIYDVDIDPARSHEPPQNGRKPKTQQENTELAAAFQALVDLLKHRSNRVGSLFSWIGIQLGRRGFDHQTLGFERFKDFMQEAERQGYVRVLTRGLQDWAYLPEQYELMTETEAAVQEEESNDGNGDIQATVAVGALAVEDQQNLLRYLSELERRSDY